MLCWGELGFEPGQDPALSVLQGQRVQQLCSRPGFTVFVLENGKVYIRRSQQTKPGLFTQFKEHKIHFADGGTSHILFLSEAGPVFLSEVKSKESAAKLKEFSIMKPQSFKCLSEINVVQVACGNKHSLALSKDGRLFAWGQNTYGQLGLDTKDTPQCTPRCVDELSGIPVAQITAGGEHSFALSLSGAVFGWGRNDHGQLGLKDTEDRRKPNYVKLLECKRTIHVSCGEEHTAVLSKDGLVFTFGAGSYGQLGHNSTKDEIKPRLVGDLFGIKVSQIACGSYHTLVFVPSSGKIYSFGRGDKGQLGNGRTSDQSVPRLVNLMDTSGNNGPENGHTTKPAVRRIFAGGNQGFAAFRDEADSESSVDQSSLIPLKRILTLDNLLEAKLCKNTRKAIIRAFSSSQTLNASFLDVSKDGHFKTSGGVSGLDMSAVRRSFKKLAENSVMLQQVTDAVQKHLIPSLPRSPAGVEALRVYLILPELIAVLKEPNDITLLTECLNRAILSLDERHFKILECWWRAMHRSDFRRLVGVYQKESERCLLLAMEVISKDNSKLHDSLKILQALYKVNSSRCQKVPEKIFCIPVMKMYKDSLMARAVRLFPGAHQSDLVQFINEIMEGLLMPQDQRYVRFSHYFIGLRKFQEQLIPYPCIFDMETKLHALNLESKIIKNRGYICQSVLQMRVSRGAILQDALECLRSVRSAAPYPALQVQFLNEPCVGHGVSQEFFTLFSRELQKNEKLFQCTDSGLLWFPTSEPEMADVFHLVGILCGLAVSNGFISNFRFPLALYKKLLRVQPTLEDLKELAPEEGKSLQYILDYEHDDIEDMLMQNFTITKKTSDGHEVPEELIPDGTNTPVQKHNRQQFVDAYVDYKFNTSVEKQFKSFSQGFRSSFTLPLVDVFLPDELMAVIHGNSKYDWELLEQNAEYDGYAHTDKAVRNFWKTFKNLPEEKKKQFLAFLSGSELIPAGGIGSVKIIIFNTWSAEPDSSYPRAYTCTKTLDLPNYSSREILREKLLYAMENSKEFNAQPP